MLILAYGKLGVHIIFARIVAMRQVNKHEKTIMAKKKNENYLRSLWDSNSQPSCQPHARLLCVLFLHTTTPYTQYILIFFI